MGGRYHGWNSCAVGTAKALLNLFQVAANPISRLKIYDIIIGCHATPADAATEFCCVRTTSVGTEGSGFTPVALDPGGVSGANCGADFGCGAFTGEPTKTANSELLVMTMNQRASVRWHAVFPGAELLVAATQNYGIALESRVSTVLTAHDVCMYFEA